MHIQAKESVIKEMIHEILGIDTPIVVNEPPVKELPVVLDPRTEYSTIFDLPPVDDENFFPSNSSQLSRSAYALAKEVDSTQINKFYRLLKKLVLKVNSEIEEPESMSALSFKESLRKEIRKILKESLLSEATPEDWEEFYADEDEEDDLLDDELSQPELPVDRERQDAMQRAKASAEKTPWVQRDKLRLKPKPKKVTWDDVAKAQAAQKRKAKADADEGVHDWESVASMSGMKSGAVRKVADRIKQREGFLMQVMDPEDRQKLVVFATNKFLSGMKDLIDPEDLEVLRLERDVVRELPSFRQFYVDSIIEPAYRVVEREKKNKLYSDMKDIGVPQLVIDTIFNMVSGRTEWDVSAVEKKYMKLGGNEEVWKQIYMLLPKYHTFMRSAPKGLDFVDLARKTWDSIPDAKKQKMFNDALEAYIEEEELSDE